MSNLKNMTLQKREWMLPLLSSVGFMVLCHGFMLVNPGYSHDGLNEVVRDMGEYQTTLGRFLQVPWKSLFGGITATWFLGLVAATAIGFAAYFLVSVLEIKRPIPVILICGMLPIILAITAAFLIIAVISGIVIINNFSPTPPKQPFPSKQPNLPCFPLRGGKI